MKKIIILIVFSVAGIFLSFGQSPQKFNYQAIARDATGNLIANQSVAFRISILQGSAGGTVVYQETHSKTTNTYGQATIAIGAGTVVSGTFSSIAWGSSSYYIKTEMDPAGGTAFALMGTTQLLTVPYALYSNTTGGGYAAGSGIGIVGTTISNTAQNATHTGDATGSGVLTVVKLQGRDIATTVPNNGQALKWNGLTSKWEPSTDNNTTYTAGTGINVTGTTVTNTAPDQTVVLNNGTGINTTGTYPNFTVTNTSPDQTVVLNNGTGISTTGTYPNFTIANSSPNATHTGDATGNAALTVVKIQGQAVSPTIPATNQVLQWNGTQWAPSNLSTPSSGWLLSGNGGTNPASNFLGTTDNNPLVFRVNNQTSGKIDNFSDNTSIGYKSLNSNLTGHSNVAYGSFALYQNTNRNNLVAIGDSALFNNGTGATAVLEATRNTAIGSNALRANTIGSNNTATGFHTMKANTIGWDNTANGAFTLNANTTGSCNTANGSGALLRNITGKDNTATGTDALRFSTTGNDNTANGMNALYYNTTGNDNSATGVHALFNNTTGYSNTANGTHALFNNTAQSNLVAIGDSALYYNGTDALWTWHATRNTAVGSKALYANTTGFDNTALGYQALLANTTGVNNTASGSKALYNNTTGYSNVAMGAGALHSTTTRSNLVAIGDSALFNNGTEVIVDHDATGNTAIGSKALFANTRGYSNTAIGREALVANINGTSNTAIGFHALFSNINGDFNIAIGNALFSNTSGNANTACGWYALSANTTGHYNTAAGYNSLGNNQTGNSNTAYGIGSLMHNQTGNYNTAIGDEVLYGNSTGSENTAIGYHTLVSNIGSWNTAVGVHALSNNTSGTNLTGFGWNANVVNSGMDDANAIGFNALVLANGRTMIGDVWQNHIGGWADWTNYWVGKFTSNVQEDVKGLGFILKLRPVTYNTDNLKLEEYLTRNFPDSIQRRYRDVKHPGFNPVRKTGFIAEEVEAAAKEAGYDFDGVKVPQNENDVYGLTYGQFVVPLVKAVQEQQIIIDDLKLTVDHLTLKNEELQRQINEINAFLKK